MNRNITPYQGDTLHETPLTLVLASYLTQLPEIFLYSFSVLCDVLTALILAKSVQKAKSFYVRKSEDISDLNRKA